MLRNFRVRSQVIVLKKVFRNHPRGLASAWLMAFLLLGALAALSVSRLKSEYSMRQFMPANHPLIIADDIHKARFQLPEVEPLFVLVSLRSEAAGTFLLRERISRLRVLTESVARKEGVSQATSLATIEGASNSAEGITVGGLLELTPFERWAERVLKDPLLTPQLISDDARTVVLAVGQPADVAQSKSAALQEWLRAEARRAFPEAEVRLGGIPAVQTEMSQTLGKELKNFLGLSVLASILTLLLFFRSLSSVCIPLFLMVLANLLSLAWMAWAGISFTVLSSTLPVLVSITVVSMSAHTMLRYAADWELATRSQAKPDPLRVLYQSYRGLFFANFLTAVTTAIGFFAIALANIPLIRQYGVTVGVSIFVCWFVVIGGLFPLLVLLPVPRARKWTTSRAVWAIFVTQHPRKTLAATGLFCVLCLFVGKDLNWTARLFDDLPEGQEARATTELVDARLGGMIPLDIVVERAEENAWNDPAALRTLDELAVRWRAYAEVGSVTGPQDLARAAGLVQGRDLPASRREAAEYAFLYSFADSNPYKFYVTGDGRAARLSLRLHDIPGTEMDSLVAKLKAEAVRAFPGWRVNAGAMATNVHFLNNELCQELIYGFWQALFAITVLLALVFRSVRWAIAAALPNLAPVAVLLGAINLGGTPIKPGIALIFSIALGISFDNTVYLMGRLRLLKNRSAKGRVEVAKAWYQEGNLCFYSSLALSAGFLVFLASYFSLNQQFGIYMLVAIAGGLLGDLLMMPAMLAACPWMIEDRKKVEAVPNLEPREEKRMTDKAVAAGIAFLLCAWPAEARAAKADPADAKALLAKVQKNMVSDDEVATVKMTILEADGSKKERTLEIRRKSGGGVHKALVRLQSPADLKGTGLLSVSKGAHSDQWLYLPSSKQTRRIQSGKRSAGFLDSELSYEDMGAASDTQVASKIVREDVIDGRKYTVVENALEGESSYGKVLVWVDAETNLVAKTEAFDKKQLPLKVSSFTNYKQFDKGVWRAQRVEVRNLQNKRGTVLELSNLKPNKGLGDEDFTESALGDLD